MAKTKLNVLVEAMLPKLEIYTKEELTEILMYMPDMYIIELYEEYIIKPLIDNKQTIAALEYKIKNLEYRIYLIEYSMYEIGEHNLYYQTLVKRKEEREEELNELKEKLNKLKEEV
jgi:UTP-glucose-1-phosphate uridylyltransferase